MTNIFSMKKYPKFIAFLAAIIAVPTFFSPAMVSAATLSAPTLKSPTSDQVLTNYPRTATFTWSAVSGADKYKLEIACDVCVSKTNKWLNAKTYTVNGTSYTVKVPGADNQFRWRVRAYDGSTAGSWSSYRYFKYDTKKNSSTVSKPVVTYPATNGQTIYADYIKIKWSGSAQEYSCEVEKYNTQTGFWQLKETCGYAPAVNSFDGHQLLTSKYGEGKYRVRVKAKYYNQNNNQWTSWSDWREFNLYQATVHTAPVINQPTENQVVTGSNVTITWNAVPGISQYGVLIAKDEFTVQGGGAFKYFTSYTNSYTYTFPSGNDSYVNGRYAAQVCLMFGDNQYGACSPVRHFTFTRDANVGGISSITSPTENQILTAGDIMFTWSAVSGATYYELGIQSWTGSNWTDLTGYMKSQTFSYFGFHNNGLYRLRIRTATENGSSSNLTYGSWSNWRNFSVDIGNSGIIGTPSLISPSDESHISSNYVNLDWSTVTDATSYEYQVTKSEGSSWISIANSTVSASDATVTLPSGNYGQYSFRVRSIRSGNYGNWSDYNHFYYDGGSNNYGAPVISTPYEDQVFTYRNISLGWSSISGASGYEVNVNYKVDGYWVNQDTYTAYTNPYSLTFNNDNDYRIRVRAKLSGSSYGNWSDWREFTVDGDANNYGSPSIYSPTESQTLTNRNVYASWSSVSGATSYDINVMYVSGSNWLDQGTYNTSQNNYNIYFYSDNNYRLRIRAKFSDYSYGNWSDWRDFTVNAGSYNGTTAPAIYSPAENALVENSNHQVNLSWQGLSGATEYTVEVVRDGYSTETLYPGSNTSYTYNASANDAWYHFRVRARLSGSNYTDWSGYRYFHYLYSGTSNVGAPTISAPTEDQTLTNRSVNMNWSTVSGATNYEVNVMYVSGSNWVDQGTYTTSNNTYNLYFSYDNYYRIRVRARLSDSSYGNWSDWREFRMYADFGNTNGAPYISTPTESQAINQSSRNITVGWSSVSNVNYYQIETSCDWCSGGSTQWQYTSIYTTYNNSYIWSLPSSDNMYRVRVRAYKTDSTYTSWSDWRTFHYFQTN
ncbi:MAG: fibronectin type III domain-containing protein [Candidatus Magasanikbacteria bacterium]|nr:fibronectin type III domain-containing protein [Candidatus Magasanikbacteria bacterium]